MVNSDYYNGNDLFCFPTSFQINYCSFFIMITQNNSIVLESYDCSMDHVRCKIDKFYEICDNDAIFLLSTEIYVAHSERVDYILFNQPYQCLNAFRTYCRSLFFALLPLVFSTLLLCSCLSVFFLRHFSFLLLLPLLFTPALCLPHLSTHVH